jgi:adenylate cyclase
MPQTPLPKTYFLAKVRPGIWLAWAALVLGWRVLLPTESIGNSISVLPFKNAGAPENTFFVDGLMGQAHASLALIPNLKVISKTSSALFRNSPEPISAIAQKLGVKYLLVGTVAQQQQQVLVNVELIKADEDRIVWTQNYEGNTQDALAFMNQVAKSIAAELRQKLSPALTKAIERMPTRNAQAYRTYLQGQLLVQSREKDKLEASIGQFDEAIALDPSFASFPPCLSAYFTNIWSNRQRCSA